MRWRVTIRGNWTELRGYIDCPHPVLVAFSEAMKPYGIVVAFPADDDYNPFKDWDQ
jgi:hypothetical protein